MRFPVLFPGRAMRPVPARWAPRMRRWLAVAGACAFAALLTVAGLPLLHRVYAAGWIAAEHYHIAFAALCAAPAAAAHGAARHSGSRGAALWLAWVPGIAAYAAFPWPQDGMWRPLWIFGHAWDWAVTIFLHWDTASAFAFNAFGAFVGMATVAFVAFGRLWLGLAKALGRSGSEALAPDGTQGALPSAEWATRREIVKDFSVPGGIVLGELTDPTRESPNFAPARPRSWGRQGSGPLITISPTEGNGHVLVTSQASGFKSTGLLIPNILTYRKGPLVVFDPKCELYARCRKARADMGFNPVVIDGRNGFDPARLIAALAEDHPSAYRRMAKMVIPQGHSGIENAAYFKAAATHLLTALLAYYAETDSPNILQDVARVLARTADGVHGVVGRRSQMSPLAFVRNQLGALEGMDEKFFASVKTEITNQLTFAEMPDIERYITMDDRSELPSQVIDPKCDIFLNIPQNVAEDFAPMVRLMLGSMLTAAQLIEVNEAPRARRLFLIDEAAKLGSMDILENIRDRGRSLGLHLMMFYQTPGEIERLWGRTGMTSWRDGCAATVMGPVSSRTSAQDLSAMLGTRTLRVRTESTSSSSQVNAPMAGSVSTSEQEQLRDVPLISPTAISQLPTHGSIITATGQKPILASKAIWFTRSDMKDRVRSTEDIRDELAVSEAQKTLMRRLAKVSWPDDEGEGSPPPAETGGQDAERTEAGSRAGESMEASESHPSAVEIEEDVEPPWETAATGRGTAGEVSDAGGAPPKLSEQAMAFSVRYDRREDRPRKTVTGKTAESAETLGQPPANRMTAEPEGGEGADSSPEDESRPQDTSVAPEPVFESAGDADRGRGGRPEQDSPAADPPAPSTGRKTEGSEPERPTATPSGAATETAAAPAQTDEGPKTDPADGRNGSAWTKAERERAMALARDESISFEEIAEELGKSVAAVKAWSDQERSRGLLPKSAGENGRPGENA